MTAVGEGTTDGSHSTEERGPRERGETKSQLKGGGGGSFIDLGNKRRRNR